MIRFRNNGDERTAVMNLPDGYPRYPWLFLLTACLGAAAFYIGMIRYAPLLGHVARDLRVDVGRATDFRGGITEDGTGDSRGFGMDNSIERIVQALADKTAIIEIMQNWGYWRDQGKWDELRTTFHPDGMISVSWFQGTFRDFVAASIKMKASGAKSKHVICGTSLQLKGNKAIAETSAILIGEISIDNVAICLTSYLRFYDLVEKRDGVWRILKRDAIYDMDYIAPVNPSDRLVLDAKELEKYPKAYRFLGYLLGKIGHKVQPNLPAVSSPEEEKIKQEASVWLER